ncbi:Alpha/beta hydrolase OS=Rhizobacter sp OX=1909292 GN=IV105_03700 PE=4 SV=1 [Rhizobacter fulvus]|jgi:phosphinothricin tripeptide acetyl hydrolase
MPTEAAPHPAESGRTIERLLERLTRLPPQTSLTLAQLRAQYERAQHAFPLGPEVALEIVDRPSVRGEWLRPVGAEDEVILYLHGGGYVIGSPRSHRHLAAAIATAGRMRAFVLDYRLAPEHPFPAALDDAVAAYRWLIDAQGVEPRRIVIAGDSAGGGLVATTLVALRDAGLPLPAAGVCLSPWTDLSCSLPSCDPQRPSYDPLIDHAVLRAMARAYLGRRSLRTPAASPLFADLRGLPPLLIQVATDEALVDDARQLAIAASQAGVHTTLEVWPRMVHVWHWYAPILDEGQRAIERIAQFARDALVRRAA